MDNNINVEVPKEEEIKFQEDQQPTLVENENNNELGITKDVQQLTETPIDTKISEAGNDLKTEEKQGETVLESRVEEPGVNKEDGNHVHKNEKRFKTIDVTLLSKEEKRRIKTKPICYTKNKSAKKNGRKSNITIKNTDGIYDTPGKETKTEVKKGKHQKSISCVTGSYQTELTLQNKKTINKNTNEVTTANPVEFTKTYERFKTNWKARDDKIKSLKEQKDKNELARIRPVPEINKASKEIFKSNKTFIERQQSFERKKQEKQRKKIESKEAKEEAERAKNDVSNKCKKEQTGNNFVDKLAKFKEWEMKKNEKIKKWIEDKKQKEWEEMKKYNKKAPKKEVEESLDRMYRDEMRKRKEKEIALKNIFKPSFTPRTNTRKKQPDQRDEEDDEIDGFDDNIKDHFKDFNDELCDDDVDNQFKYQTHQTTNKINGTNEVFNINNDKPKSGSIKALEVDNPLKYQTLQSVNQFNDTNEELNINNYKIKSESNPDVVQNVIRERWFKNKRGMKAKDQE